MINFFVLFCRFYSSAKTFEHVFLEHARAKAVLISRGACSHVSVPFSSMCSYPTILFVLHAAILKGSIFLVFHDYEGSRLLSWGNSYQHWPRETWIHMLPLARSPSAMFSWAARCWGTLWAAGPASHVTAGRFVFSRFSDFRMFHLQIRRVSFFFFRMPSTKTHTLPPIIMEVENRPFGD